MIWSFIGFAYPVVDSVFNVKDPKISVNPEFNCEILQLEYKGIYKLKIIHIIYIAIMVTKLILKYKKEITNGGV